MLVTVRTRQLRCLQTVLERTAALAKTALPISRNFQSQRQLGSSYSWRTRKLVGLLEPCRRSVFPGYRSKRPVSCQRTLRNREVVATLSTRASRLRIDRRCPSSTLSGHGPDRSGQRRHRVVCLCSACLWSVRHDRSRASSLPIMAPSRARSSWSDFCPIGATAWGRRRRVCPGKRSSAGRKGAPPSH
jgi:hypothetical protein